MSFAHYYSAPASDYFLTFLLWGGSAFALCVLLAICSRKGILVASGIIGGLLVGLIVGPLWVHFTEDKANTSIVEANIMKKYDVQSVSFETNLNTPSSRPNQSNSQYVSVKVNGGYHMATLTQNPDTAEPTLVDGETNKELLHKDAKN